MTHLRLRKLHEDYDPSNKINAVKNLMEAHEKGEVLTGIFYIDTQKPNFIDLLNVTCPDGKEYPDAVAPPER